MQAGKPSTIDEYISSLSAEVQEVMLQVRSAIQQAAPKATETISYAIPTFTLNGKPVVHFAAFKSHIGLYATPQGHEAFEKELSKYKQGKGSVQFPLDQPMPIKLIEKITKFRVQQVLEQTKKAKSK